MVVGASGADLPGAENAGLVYVFRREDTRWLEDAILSASEPSPSGEFGISLAVQGEKIVVGASWASLRDQNQVGAAFVFRREGTEWVEEAILSASDAEEGGRFGYSVSLSGDRIVVGSPYKNRTDAEDAGAVYVFAFDGSSWIEEASISPLESSPLDQFGFSVSLDGEALLVGAPQRGGIGFEFSGAAYLFDHRDGQWLEKALLSPGDRAAADFFGYSVSLNADTAVVSAPYGNLIAFEDAGAAYAFSLMGVGWTEEAKLTAVDAAAYDYFGTSVSVQGDRIVVGSPNDDHVGYEAGSAYVFRRSESGWGFELNPSAEGAIGGEGFGTSVAFDGNSIAVGSPYLSFGNILYRGSVHVDALNDLNCTPVRPPRLCGTGLFGMLPFFVFGLLGLRWLPSVSSHS